MIPVRDLALLSCLSLAAAGCVGTTGSDLVTFEAAAAGPTDAVKGQPYTFHTSRGYDVTLTQATLHIGAIYLNNTVPTSGSQSTNCTLPGIYVAQVADSLDVDLLSSDPQPFADPGAGTETRAVVGEVWLMHGDVNDTMDTTPILQLAGTAVGSKGTYPFEATITIGQNRLRPVENPAMPSQFPICKEHIVSPILLQNGVTTNITPKNGGSLLLRVDPKGLFVDVDFSRVAQVRTSPPLYQFADASTDTPSKTLYANLHAQNVYEFFWIDSPNP